MVFLVLRPLEVGDVFLENPDSVPVLVEVRPAFDLGFEDGLDFVAESRDFCGGCFFGGSGLLQRFSRAGSPLVGSWLASVRRWSRRSLAACGERFGASNRSRRARRWPFAVI